MPILFYFTHLSFRNHFFVAEEFKRSYNIQHLANVKVILNLRQIKRYLQQEKLPAFLRLNGMFTGFQFPIVRKSECFCLAGVQGQRTISVGTLVFRFILILRFEPCHSSLVWTFSLSWRLRTAFVRNSIRWSLLGNGFARQWCMMTSGYICP